MFARDFNRKNNAVLADSCCFGIPSFPYTCSLMHVGNKNIHNCWMTNLNISAIVQKNNVSVSKYQGIF